MFQTPRKPRTILRSTTVISGIAGASLLFSLFSPTLAFATESSSLPSANSSRSTSTEISPEGLVAVSKEQIQAANSGVKKFSATDVLAQVRDQIESDRLAREKKRAEEKAAKLKAEAEAKAKAKAKAAAKAKAEADAAAAKAKAAAEAAAAEAAAIAKRSSVATTSSAPGVQAASPTPLYTGGGSKDEWLRGAGIPESDWAYVDYIVSHESGWNPNAVNASSGASGLVQALPCGKVVGSCFNPVDNLKWADGYAKGRYGSWAGAYAFWSSNNWW